MTNEQNTEEIGQIIPRLQSLISDLKELGVLAPPPEDIKKVTQQRDLLAQALWVIYREATGDEDMNPNPGSTIAELSYDGYAAKMINEITSIIDEDKVLNDQAPVDLSALRQLRLGLALGTVSGTPQEISMAIGRALGDVPAEVEP